MPASGVGVAWPVGEIVSGFAAGSPADPGQDDTAWNTSGYPRQGEGNKTAGIELAIPTLGHTNISIQFEQRASGTASRFARLQFSTNGLDFVDFALLELTEPSLFATHEVSLSQVGGVDDNPDFKVRVVTEFESTATGSGADEYATPSTSNYSTAGTLRFDVVTVAGEPIQPANTLPIMQPIADQTIVEAVSTGPIDIFLSDAETPNEELLFVVSSFNLDLFPLENLTVATTASGKTLEVLPALGQIGTGTLALTVMDQAGGIVSQEFVITVSPANAAPTLSVIPNQTTLVNETIPALLFTIDDLETPADLLEITLSASNPGLVEQLSLAGGGSQRSLMLSPHSGQAGTSSITVEVSDGFRTSEQTFVWMVLPRPSLLVYDSFGYSNGPIISNAPGVWIHHAGTAGQAQCDAGQLLLSTSQSEDIHLNIPGGPYGPEDGIVLYIACRLRCTQLPSSSGQYFLHLNTSGFRARVFASAETDTAYRLGVANNGTIPTLAPVLLNVDQDYTVVVSYDPGTGRTSLWIDPASASEPPTQADDEPAPASISALAFRQQSGIGRFAVKELQVGTGFEQVVPGQAYPLWIEQVGKQIQLSWPLEASDWQLQSSGTLNPAIWQEVTDVPQVETNRVVLRLEPVSDNRFFKLQQP